MPSTRPLLLYFMVLEGEKFITSIILHKPLRRAGIPQFMKPRLGFCSPPRSHERQRLLLLAATKYWLATSLLCDLEPVTAPLWARSSSSMQLESQRWSPRVISSQSATILWFISTTGTHPDVPTRCPHFWPSLPPNANRASLPHSAPQLQTSDGSLLLGLTFKALHRKLRPMSTSPSPPSSVPVTRAHQCP